MPAGGGHGRGAATPGADRRCAARTVEGESARRFTIAGRGRLGVSIAGGRLHRFQVIIPEPGFSLARERRGISRPVQGRKRNHPSLRRGRSPQAIALDSDGLASSEGGGRCIATCSSVSAPNHAAHSARIPSEIRWTDARCLPSPARLYINARRWNCRMNCAALTGGPPIARTRLGCQEETTRILRLAPSWSGNTAVGATTRDEFRQE